MNTFCLHITGSQSTRLMRIARKGELLTATPTPHHHVSDLPSTITTADDLGFPNLLRLLDISANNPLNVLVPSKEARRWSGKARMRTKVLSEPLPDGVFLELRDGKGSATHSGLRIPDGLRVFIQAPGLTLIQGAQAITRGSKGQRRSIDTNDALGLSAFLKLLAFADECCGLYSRDDQNPRTGPIAYDEPGTTSRFVDPLSLQSFLAETAGIDGITLARRVARYAIDESGSPMETYVNHALTLPPRYAGLSMQQPLANKQLVLEDAERAALKHSSLRPDLQWPQFKMLSEYLGDKEHADKSARIEDKNRLQDYAQSSYTAYPLMFDDVRNAEALNRTAEMLARAFMQRGLKGELYRVRKLIKNETFLARQRILIATLLPPVMRYDNLTQ